MSVTAPGIAGGAGRPTLTPALVPGLDIAAAVTGEEASFASVLRDVPVSGVVSVSGVSPAAGKKMAVASEADSLQNLASDGVTLDMLDEGKTGNTPKMTVAPAEASETIPMVTTATGESGLSEPKIHATSDKAKKVEDWRDKDVSHPPADPADNAVAPKPLISAAMSEAVAQTPVDASRKTKAAGAQASPREVAAHTVSGRTISGAESHLPPSEQSRVPGAKAEPTSLPRTSKVQQKGDDEQPDAPVTATNESGMQEPAQKRVSADGFVNSARTTGEAPQPSVEVRSESDGHARRIAPDRIAATDDRLVMREKTAVPPHGEKSAEATALLDLIRNKRTENRTTQPLAGVFGRTSPPEGEAAGRIADGIVRVPSPARDKGALPVADAAEKRASTGHGAVVTQILAQLRPAGPVDTVMVAETGSPAASPHVEKPGPAGEGHMPAVAEKAQKMLQDVRASLAGLFGKSGNDTPQARDDAVEPGRGDLMATRLTPSSPPVMGAVSVSPPVAAAPSGEFTVSGALGRQVVDMGVSGQWIEDIARQVASIATNPGHGSFRIASDVLGAVQVDIRPGPQGSDIMIATDSDAAQAALSQDRERLVQDARLASIRIGEVRIEKIAAPGEAARGDMQGNGQQSAGTSHSGGQSASMHGGGQHGQHGQQGGRPDASTFAGDGQRGNSPKTSFTQSVLNDAANGRGEAERGNGRGDRARYA